jgi:hypothetical protein
MKHTTPGNDHTATTTNKEAMYLEAGATKRPAAPQKQKQEVRG